MMVKDKVPVSVVIPCYCCSETVLRAVDSVRKQSYLPEELILVNDASSDDGKTLRVLAKIKEDLSSLFDVKVVKLQNNSGPATARNKGWDIAAQPYTAFLDADDSWHPEKLKVQYKWMMNNPECVLSGHQCIVWDEQAVNEQLELKDVKASVLNPWHIMLKNPFSTPTVMVSNKVSTRFREGSFYAEDYLLWQQVVFSEGMVARIELPLAYTHKELYGVQGLSSHMWAMEKGELSNYWILYRQSFVSFGIALLLTVYSLMKYVRRLLIVYLRQRL